ncbi:MAG TPA: ABC transporter permease [Longimicrobium sp.]|jgi:simple sugar transport system permease protein|uniref:ABC transporter permease n=1 Tax=Longimicrobium sp. TaxID=2029185 RepID=UPI002EDAEDBA
MLVLAFLLQTIRIAIPYLFAASGGMIAERAGVVSLTLEGFMLSGAFTATLGAYYSGNPWIGLLCGILGGLAMGLVHAVACIRYRADQIVVGMAINLLVVGLTRFFLHMAFDSSSNSPRVAGFGGEGASTGLGALASNPLVWMGLLLVPVMAWLMFRTAFGLRVRAVGEHPAAASSVGVPVSRVRYTAVALSGMLAALGGVYLALDQHQFTDQITAGRGFIALAAVIFGRWHPVRTAIACLLFAAAETLQIQLQAFEIVPSQFVAIIPYVLTIVALAGVIGRSVSPAALGKAED